MQGFRWGILRGCLKTDEERRQGLGDDMIRRSHRKTDEHRRKGDLETTWSDKTLRLCVLRERRLYPGLFSEAETA